MAGYTMPEGMTSYDGSSLVLGPGETAHSISGNSLDNQINGSGITDYIYGGGGNDQVWGNNGDDVILGESGNDNLYGGNGNDLLLGGEGNDILIGNNGNDRLWGGTGDDIYYITTQDTGVNGLHFDSVNDDLSAAGNPGFGGGTDTVFLSDVTSAQVSLHRFGDDLVISTKDDAADGSLTSGVILDDFFLGGNNVIEKLQTSDNLVFDLTQFLG